MSLYCTISESNSPSKPHFTSVKMWNWREDCDLLGTLCQWSIMLPREETVDKILKAPPPKTIKQLRAFLGLESFYRKYVPDFNAIAAPLTDATKKMSRKEWSPRASFPRTQEQNQSSAYSEASRCLRTIYSADGCFTYWNWHSPVAGRLSWRKVTNCFREMQAATKREKLLHNWVRMSWYRLGSNEIPGIPLW